MFSLCSSICLVTEQTAVLSRHCVCFLVQIMSFGNWLIRQLWALLHLMFANGIPICTWSCRLFPVCILTAHHVTSSCVWLPFVHNFHSKNFLLSKALFCSCLRWWWMCFVVFGITKRAGDCVVPVQTPWNGCLRKQFWTLQQHICRQSAIESRFGLFLNNSAETHASWGISEVDRIANKHIAFAKRPIHIFLDSEPLLCILSFFVHLQQQTMANERQEANPFPESFYDKSKSGAHPLKTLPQWKTIFWVCWEFRSCCKQWEHFIVRRTERRSTISKIAYVKQQELYFCFRLVSSENKIVSVSCLTSNTLALQNAEASYDFSSNDPFPYPRYTDDWFNR